MTGPALPTPVTPSPTAPRPASSVVRRPGGSEPLSASNSGVVLRFIVGLVLIAVAAFVIVQVLTPPDEPPDCVPGDPCGIPPPKPPGPGPIVVADPLVSLGRLENDEFGYGLAYAEDWWTPASDEGSELKLVIEWEEYGDPELWLLGAPSTDRTPDQLMADQLDMLRERFLGLSADEHDENAILDPAIGFERGSATSGTFAGTTDSPQGPGRAVLVFMEAVTDGRLTLSAALVLTGNYTLDTSHDSPTMWFRVKADNVLNAITWPVR